MDMEIRDILRNRRLELHLTLKQIADAVGVSEGTVSRWESGDIDNMRRDKIAALSKVLSLDPRVIMGWGAVDDHQYPGYYTDETTARIAEDMATNPNLRALFDIQRNMDPEDLQAMYGMALALKRKAERLDADDPV